MMSTEETWPGVSLLLWQRKMRQRGSFRNPMATELCICSSWNVWLLEKQRARERDCRGNWAYLSGWERTSRREHPQSGQITTKPAARDSSMLTVICAWSRARCREHTVKSPTLQRANCEVTLLQGTGWTQWQKAWLDKRSEEHSLCLCPGSVRHFPASYLDTSWECSLSVSGSPIKVEGLRSHPSPVTNLRCACCSCLLNVAAFNRSEKRVRASQDCCGNGRSREKIIVNWIDKEMRSCHASLWWWFQSQEHGYKSFSNTHPLKLNI